MSLSTLLDAIERTLSAALEAGPLRVLHARLEPVHIVRDVERLLDRHALVTDGGIVVPHQAQVRLHPSDVSRLGAAGEALEADLAARVQRAVRARGRRVLGPMVVKIAPDDAVAVGRVKSEIISVAAIDGPHDPLPVTSRLPTIKPNGPNVRISLPNGHAETFTKSVISIGRDSENDFVVPDSRVSRRHAELHAQGELMELRDLQSTNGTWISGRQIQVEKLACPAEVSLGGVEIRIETAKS
jgi:hypothetical protein